jgi:hypothetical protein
MSFSGTAATISVEDEAGSNGIHGQPKPVVAELAGVVQHERDLRGQSLVFSDRGRSLYGDAVINLPS